MSQAPEDLRALQQLKHLEVKVYRNLHLNANNTDTSVIDQWIERQNSHPADLERLLNHVHIYDFFPNVQNEVELERVATEIACSWESILSDLDPKYRVLKFEGYGPEVTFYLDRETQDMDEGSA